jgi:adenylate cyclase
VQERKFAVALADIEKWRRTENSPAIWAVQAYVYGRSGRLKEARQSLVKFEQLNEHKHMEPKWLLSLAYMGIGDKEQFFACLEKALRERSNSLTGLKVDPIYDVVRNDPRFQKLEHRVGLVK